MRLLALVLLVAGAYFAAACYGLTLAWTRQQVSAIWPASGIALTAVLLGGYRVWPGILLGAFAADARAHEPLAVAALIAAGCTAGAVAGAWALRRLRLDVRLERTHDVLVLMLVAALSPLIAASLGTTALAVGHLVPWRAYASVCRLWWTGDSVGILILAPLLLTWAGTARVAWRMPRSSEAVAYLLLLLTLAFGIFVIPGDRNTPYYPHPYFAFPLLTWAGLRFGARETTLSIVTICAFAVHSIVHGSAPFAAASPAARLVSFDLFISVMSGSALLLVAVNAERRRAEAIARASDRLLQQSYEQLELRVAERTAELQKRSRENEVLLKEVHHRVKNNMQIISSLLSLQARQLDAPPLVRLLHELRDRVRSMALVHEHLYGASELHSIPLRGYLRALVDGIAQSQGRAGIRYSICCEDVALEVDQAVPCGLIINELVTNAFKHAFPGGADGNILVSVERDSVNRLVLTVSDDGIGLTAPAAAPAGRPESFGLHLVHMLAQQLEAELSVRVDGGTEFRLNFAQKDTVPAAAATLRSEEPVTPS